MAASDDSVLVLMVLCGCCYLINDNNDDNGVTDNNNVEVRLYSAILQTGHEFCIWLMYRYVHATCKLQACVGTGTMSIKKNSGISLGGMVDF